MQTSLIPPAIASTNSTLLAAIDSMKQAAVLLYTAPTFSFSFPPPQAKVDSLGREIFGGAYISREPCISLLEPCAELGYAGAQFHLLNAYEALRHAGNDASVERIKRLVVVMFEEAVIEKKEREMRDPALVGERREKAVKRWQEHRRRRREWEEMLEFKRAEFERVVEFMVWEMEERERRDVEGNK